jgi:hypothetical protein
MRFKIGYLLPIRIRNFIGIIGAELQQSVAITVAPRLPVAAIRKPPAVRL